MLEALEESATGRNGAGVGLLRVWSQLHDCGGPSSANYVGMRRHSAGCVLSGKVIVWQLYEVVLLEGHRVEGWATLDSGQGSTVSRHVHMLLAGH